MKRILITLSFIVFVIANAMAYDYDFSAECESGQTLYYKIINSYYNVAVVQGETTQSGNLVIPNVVDDDGTTYSVLSIFENAFANCSGLTSITVPNSVAYIAKGAFSGCSSLESIILPFVGDREYDISQTCKPTFGCIFGENSYSGGQATSQYSECRVKNYYIPTTLKEVIISGSNLIPDYAFQNCSNITSITISDSVKDINIGAFQNCTGLVSFSIPHSLSSIATSLFNGCNSLTSITIPSSVTTIYGGAFYNCSNLNLVTIPISVTTIEKNAFNSNNITFICEAPSRPKGWFWNNSYMQQENVAWNYNMGTIYWGVSFVKDCIAYKIGDNNTVTAVKYIGTADTLEIPAIVALDSVEYDVTNIGSNAFENCNSLKSIIIPHSVLSIDDYVFSNSENIVSITMNQITPPIINQATFDNFDSSLPISIPCGSINNYKTAMYWKNLNNYIEEFPHKLSVLTEDESMGSTGIIEEPTCSEDATIKAIAKSGYIFYQWSDGNKTNPRSITVDRDTTIIARFVLDEICFTLSSSNTSQGTVTESSGTYHYYDNVTFSATANYGYHFSQWSDGVTKNPRTIQLIKDTVIEAQFAVNQYSIQLQSNDTNMGSANGAGSFDYLSTNKISATPKTGYVFYHWSDENTDNPRTITLTCDTAFTAVFVPDEVNVEVKSADTEHGTVTELSGVYHFNEKIIISAIAVPHYHFESWSDGNRQNPREVLLRGDTVLTAAFGIDTFSVAAKCDTAMGAVSGAGLYSYGSAAKVEAKPAAHHHFVQWKNGAVQTTQEFVVEHDTTFEAVFAIDRHSVALAASDSLCGAVSGAGSYDYGASVQLQATPAANCYFTGWSDGVTTNPRTLTVEGDTNIVAEFGKLQTVNIMVAANDTLRGTVAGTGSYVVGSNATLSATASAHYLFEQWSDGRTDNPRTVRAIADATYTAVFVPMQYNIILSQNNADMGMVSGSGVYSYGERASCLAKPYPNYHFVQWSNGETANPYEFVVEEDKMLTAYFAAGAVTAIGNESAIEPTIYAIGNTIVVENATDEICVYNAMGKLICRDAIHRVRAELRVNAAGVYIVKTGNVVMRVMIND